MLNPDQRSQSSMLLRESENEREKLKNLKDIMCRELDSHSEGEGVSGQCCFKIT